MLSTTKIIITNSGLSQIRYQSVTEILKGFIMQNKKFALGVLLALVATASQAAVDPAVSTAISGAVTDVSATGALILGVVVAIAVIGWIRHVLR